MMMPTAGAARGVAAGRFADAGRVFGLVRARAMARWYGMAACSGRAAGGAAQVLPSPPHTRSATSTPAAFPRAPSETDP
jgi:hypothetical protein